MKPMRAGDRDRGADAERDADHHHEPRAVDVDAERGGGVLAERQRAKGARVDGAAAIQLATKNGAAIMR